jgi:DNA-binding transcriptional MerR regulator
MPKDTSSVIPDSLKAIRQIADTLKGQDTAIRAADISSFTDTWLLILIFGAFFLICIMIFILILQLKNYKKKLTPIIENKEANRDETMNYYEGLNKVLEDFQNSFDLKFSELIKELSEIKIAISNFDKRENRIERLSSKETPPFVNIDLTDIRNRMKKIEDNEYNIKKIKDELGQNVFRELKQRVDEKLEVLENRTEINQKKLEKLEERINSLSERILYSGLLEKPSSTPQSTPEDQKMSVPKTLLQLVNNKKYFESDNPGEFTDSIKLKQWLSKINFSFLHDHIHFDSKINCFIYEDKEQLYYFPIPAAMKADKDLFEKKGGGNNVAEIISYAIKDKKNGTTKQKGEVRCE